ncbi:hypothetical protein O0I10_005833 [Lichtheimia ornata]|uniref:Armadillo-type protein n=1 Tax=Lichtheimia ornata TaxID=688661 RepID=A0AAD7V448_9FUNG|nr:uncharacterized protein O0I10_005833 [Lichtheimia ornata]KAJ8658480.1 hypothetical protein O0I10_005833 [Lichtheimia ornata]
MDDEYTHASNLFEAIPHISREVDDTLYEKVFSFLNGVISKSTLQQLESLNALDVLNQTCEQPEQDYRVRALCFRLLGSIVSHNPIVFQALQTTYSRTLDLIMEGLHAEEPAMRCASLEICRSFLSCEPALEWIINHKAVTDGIQQGFTDTSLYVVAESCRTFRLVIEKHGSSRLYQTLNPTSQIKNIIRQRDKNVRLLLSALEFCWVMVDSKSKAALDYMLHERLLSDLLPLIHVTNRIALLKTLEILTVIFEWVPSPLSLLLEDEPVDLEGDSDIKKAYEYMVGESARMTEGPAKLTNVLTSVSLKEATLPLLTRFASAGSPQVNTLHQEMLDLLNACTSPSLSSSANNQTTLLLNNVRTLHSRKSIIQVILRILNTLVSKFPGISMSTTLDAVEGVLEKSELSSDQRVLKLALKLILTLFHNFANADSVDIVSKTMRKLLWLLNEKIMGGRSAALVLETFQELMAHDKLGTLMMDKAVAGSFIMALELMLVNQEWDVRDSAIEFIGNLFKPPRSEFKMAFALEHKLPFMVLRCINDKEPYVRATALDVLQNFMRSKDGWYFIQQHQRIREVASQLPRFLYDTEAFVRRAALDAICCLVSNRSCEGMTIESTSSTEQTSLNPIIVSKLMDDPDSDVIMRMLQVLYAFWKLHLHENAQQKRTRTEDDDDAAMATEPESVFFMIKGDHWIIEATKDTQRRVRAQAYDVIQHILRDYPHVSMQKGEHKRAFDETPSKEQEFINALGLLDMEKLQGALDPEHIFQEALDINAAMMTMSLDPKNPDDDRNILDCYN